MYYLIFNISAVLEILVAIISKRSLFFVKKYTEKSTANSRQLENIYRIINNLHRYPQQ